MEFETKLTCALIALSGIGCAQVKQPILDKGQNPPALKDREDDVTTQEFESLFFDSRGSRGVMPGTLRPLRLAHQEKVNQEREARKRLWKERGAPDEALYLVPLCDQSRAELRFRYRNQTDDRALWAIPLKEGATRLPPEEIEPTTSPSWEVSTDFRTGRFIVKPSLGWEPLNVAGHDPPEQKIRECLVDELRFQVVFHRRGLSIHSTKTGEKRELVIVGEVLSSDRGDLDEFMARGRK